MSGSTPVSRTPEGYYYIVNAVPDTDTNPDGSETETPLAITYNGINATLTVTAFNSNQSSQEWYIANYTSDGSTQSISPGNNTNLQVCFGGNNTLTVLPASNYVWAIGRNNTDVTYTIQDGGLSLSWGLQGEDVEEGQNVYVPDSGPAPNQDWRLIATLPPSY